MFQLGEIQIPNLYRNQWLFELVPAFEPSLQNLEVAWRKADELTARDPI